MLCLSAYKSSYDQQGAGHFTLLNFCFIFEPMYSPPSLSLHCCFLCLVDNSNTNTAQTMTWVKKGTIIMYKKTVREFEV